MSLQASCAFVSFLQPLQYVITYNRTNSKYLQVQADIVELRQGWVEERVERVTAATFQLYQIREQLRQCKVGTSLGSDTY